MAHKEKDFKVWNDGYVQAMRDVWDWIADDLKAIPYGHIIADIAERIRTSINEIEREKK